jgi:hypothetical protein
MTSAIKLASLLSFTKELAGFAAPRVGVPNIGLSLERVACPYMAALGCKLKRQDEYRRI